jgi:hypothetical protein
MQMSDDTIKKYPKLHYYLKVNMPQVAEVHKIINAIQKTGWKSDQGDHQECPEMGSGTHDPGGAQSDVCWQESLWLLLVGFQYIAD